MAGTGYSSGTGWDEDMPINSLEKPTIQPRSTPSPTKFKAGRVYPSDGGWTTADSESRTVITRDKRYVLIKLAYLLFSQNIYFVYSVQNKRNLLRSDVPLRIKSTHALTSAESEGHGISGWSTDAPLAESEFDQVNLYSENELYLYIYYFCFRNP
jgi:hypothetical protein